MEGRFEPFYLKIVLIRAQNPLINIQWFIVKQVLQKCWNFKTFLEKFNWNTEKYTERNEDIFYN